MNALKLCTKLAERVKRLGGNTLFVGGCVRDSILGVSAKDYDIEIYGIEEEKIDYLLLSVGANVLRVGRSFPVWKIWSEKMGQGDAIDVALPRREIKMGEGHMDFNIVLDPFMSYSDSFVVYDKRYWSRCFNGGNYRHLRWCSRLA